MSQFKNQKEVLEALLAGKKIRDKSWNNSGFMFLDEKGNLKDEFFREYRCIPEFQHAEIYTPPKKKVAKTIERWVNVYPHLTTTHHSKDAADNNSSGDRIACVKLTGTYEVEEDQ